MKTINNSEGKPNYSQRMNPIDAMNTCNVTASATALLTAGYDLATLNKGYHERPPMDLLLFLQAEPSCRLLYDSIDPRHATPAYEYMDVLAMAIGKYIGIPGTLKVHYSAPIKEILEAIEDGKGIVIHGLFTFARRDGSTVMGGHFESLCGATFDEATGEAESWIVDDPFGNPNTNYVDTAGNDIEICNQQFIEEIKPVGAALGKDAIFIPRAS